MVATIKDLAKIVGKSVTTVSRALNDYDDVSPETKALVQQVAEEMGYQPNTLAQRLQKQRSDTFGLIIPTFAPRFSDPFFSEFLAGVGNKASELGFDLLVSTHAPGDNELDAYRKMVNGRRVDGFIIVRTRCDDPRVNFLLEKKVPFTSFGRVDNHTSFPFVDEDGAYGMRLLADHIASLGHKRIAIISAPMDLMFTHFRLEGLREGLATHGLNLDDSLVLVGNLTQQAGFEMTKKLLEMPKLPTAIIAFNDLTALGAMGAIQEKGMVVGKDISVTGFDDIPMAAYSHPPLTTIHQPVYKIGRMICEMLADVVQGKELEESQVLLQPRLIIRESSGKK